MKQVILYKAKKLNKREVLKMSVKELLIKYGYELKKSKFQGRKDIFKDGKFIGTITAWEAGNFLNENHGGFD